MKHVRIGVLFAAGVIGAGVVWQLLGPMAAPTIALALVGGVILAVIDYITEKET